MFEFVVGSHPMDIRAPAEDVWGILADVEKYGEWNPFTTRVESALEVASPVDLLVDMRFFKTRQRQWIQAVEPPGLLAWGMAGGARLLLLSRREQRLETRGDRRCRYHTTDTFSGLLAPLVVLLFGRIVRRGFNDAARALKARAEAPERGGDGCGLVDVQLHRAGERRFDIPDCG